ncbi:MAG: DUF3299 domain-containing protein [Glaciecola sp.]
MTNKIQTALFYTLLYVILLTASALNGNRVHAEQAYVNIEWIQLMPAEDLEALLNPPEFISSIEDGAAQDSIDTLNELSEGNETAARFNEALKSSKVVDAFNNQNVRLPGFVVPIESDENQKITSFFIVPYFGACLHLPPPPPNQIIYVETDEGIELDVLYDPLLFEGTIVIKRTQNALGTSAYTLRLDSAEPYQG